jgi:tRNA threonylcarbamoyladenosine modification (KEOPS) complex Cgi121 subunit/molybdopterin converting factor small subunit
LIIVKFLGIAKKSFNIDKITINKDHLTIQKLLDSLLEKKPENTPDLDFNNLLVAVNGIDSSAIDGKQTKLKSGDVVSLIPIIHGGSNRQQFRISQSFIELFEIKAGHKFNVDFLDSLRKKFPNLIIQGILSTYILNKAHAKKIVSISLAAQKNHTLLSKKIETDIIMRFAGTTQISYAIENIGIKLGKSFFIIAIGKQLPINKLRQNLKEFLNHKLFLNTNHNFLKKKFHISNLHIDSIKSKTPLEDLLSEKAAILI